MSDEDPCLHFEAKLVTDLRTKIKKRLIAAICDLKQPCQMEIEKFENTQFMEMMLNANEQPQPPVPQSFYLPTFQTYHGQNYQPQQHQFQRIISPLSSPQSSIQSPSHEQSRLGHIIMTTSY